MFLVQCPTHDAQVLLGPRMVEHLENVEHGIHVHWRCYCGTSGVLRIVDDVEVDAAVAA